MNRIFKIDEFYHLKDNFGIPILVYNNFEIRIQLNEDDILQKIEIENDPSFIKLIDEGTLLISHHQNNNIVIPNFPEKFNLSTNQQVELVFKWFKDTTGFQINNFNILLELPILPNTKIPFILLLENNNSEKKLVLAKNVIDGNLNIKKKYRDDGLLLHNWISTFGKISKINGDLYIDNEMEDLGDLEIVNGNLSFSNYTYQNKLESLYPLKIIKGDLYLKNLHASLGTIEYIGGNLNLRKTTVKDLGALKSVGGNVLISKSQKDYLNFDKILVKGKIRYYNDNFNLGKLTLSQE